MASLNPRMSLGRSIGYGLEIHNPEMDAEARRAAVVEMLERVGLAPANYFYNKLPHQTSGGQSSARPSRGPDHPSGTRASR